MSARPSIPDPKGPLKEELASASATVAAIKMLQSDERSSDKMGPSMPLSPNSVYDGQLPQGFCDLVQHNNSAAFPYEHGPAEAGSVHSSPYPPSRVTTPGPQASMSPHLEQHGLPQYAPHGTYNPQFFQPTYRQDSSAYPTLPDDSVQPGYTTPASSPSQRSEVINLRNGTVSRSSNMRPIASKGRPDKPTTKKARAKAVRKTPKITVPLSEATKHLTVPMIDIDAYVNRSEADRKYEVENSKTPGKIKRPMNAFMLYRKAYQGRTKDHCTQNNHQLVSQVCGDSWPLEPEEIRNQFTEWARIERENHAKTWPEYKFAPKKPKDLKRKAEEEGGEEELPLEDYDHETGRLIKRSRSNQTTPVPEAEHLYAQQVPYYAQYSPQQAGIVIPGRGQVQMSSFEWSNPNKPMPAPYNHMSLQQQSHYLSSQAMPTRHQHLSRFGVEDVAFHKTAAPGNPYHSPPQNLMEQYASGPNPPGLDHTGQHDPFFSSAQFTAQFEAPFDHQFNNSLYQTASDGSFNPSDPLLLPPNTIEDFGINDQTKRVSSEGYAIGGAAVSFDGQMDGQLRGILQGSSNGDWHIQQLSDAQAESQFESDWSAHLDPSLSEPYNTAVQD